jgi:hypothetical protein
MERRRAFWPSKINAPLPQKETLTRLSPLAFSAEMLAGLPRQAKDETFNVAARRCGIL